MSLPKQRPLIGLTGPLLDERPGSWHAVPNAYVQAVYAAGGMPVHIPCLPGEEVAAELLGRLDGLVLTGGGDVDPFHFGESPHPALGRICPRRDALELPLVRAALAADLPLLAICRGIQVLNIATGGTVYQDLGSQLANPLQHVQNAPRWYPTHAVELSPDSRLYAIYRGQSIRVNSFHHQAIRDVAPGLVVTARAPDGVIEGVEHPEATFVVGVQWHPECMITGDAGARRLFAALVEAAGLFARRRSSGWVAGTADG